MKRVIVYKDGEELNEDNGFIPQDITDVVCRIKKSDKYRSDCGSLVKGTWKLTLILERVR